MGKIAVIDTETTWGNRVMSIGTVIADADTFRPLDEDPEKDIKSSPGLFFVYS